jgi:hypothetical protein
VVRGVARRLDAARQRLHDKFAQSCDKGTTVRTKRFTLDAVKEEMHEEIVKVMQSRIR